MSGILQSLFGQSNNQNTTTNQNTTGQQNTNQSGNSATSATEDPLFTMFRQSILPALSQQFANAQKPVYGDAQTAQVANQANQAGQAAQTAVANNAARRGTLNAGSTDAANTAIQQGVTGKVIDFQNQIPFLNQQAQWGKTQDLLGLATNFLGRAPLGSTTSSNQFGQTDTSQQSTGSQHTSGRQGGLFG